MGNYDNSFVDILKLHRALKSLKIWYKSNFIQKKISLMTIKKNIVK
jgi:hypothetical protein